MTNKKIHKTQKPMAEIKIKIKINQEQVKKNDARGKRCAGKCSSYATTLRDNNIE